MSLTNRIVGLVALALVPALAIQGYNEYALRAARTEAVRAEAMRSARSVASDLGQFGRGVRQALRILAEVPEVQGKDPEVCTPYLRTLLDKVPGAFFFGVIDGDGRVVCNTLGSARGAYSLADRQYFQDAMRDGFAVGEYVRGRITDRPTIQLAQAIPAPDGKPAGVVLASVDLDYLAGQLARAGLPADGTLTVADRKGAILIRVPDQAEWVGKLLPPAYQATLQANRGQVVDMLGLRGTMRITGVSAATPDDLDGITVAIGLSPAAAFADIDAATRRGMILIVLGAALALAAALLAGRAFIREPVHRLLRTASAWRGGNLDARTGIAGPSEFGQLGEAFDAMAAALQKHEGELRSEISRGHLMQERQTMMLHELNHRVRNTLATVQSLARQSRRNDITGERLEGRILALSKTHDLLSRDDWSGASLVTVLENELSPFGDGLSHRFRLDGPDVELAPRYVLALGMTVHELTSNAAKYGALSAEGGCVDITWRVVTGESGMRRLTMEWRESGGPSVKEPRRRGYGTRLITGGITQELGGTVRLAFEPTGLRCTADVPLDAQDRFTSFREASGVSSKPAA